MKISGFDKIISIERFEYLSRVDRHETCFFSAYVKKDDADAARGMAGSDVTFDDDDRFKFTGHVTDVAVSYDISGVYIEVQSVGKTYLYDKDRFSRVFQNGKKSVSDVISEMESMSDVDYKCKEDPAIGSVLFQDNETDWSFIVPLINRFGLHLFPQEKSFVGKHGDNQEIELKEEDLIDYKLTTGADCSSMVCRIDKALNLGNRARYSGKHFFVASKKYVLEKEKYYFEYGLLEITKDSEVKPDSTDAYLYAKVTDNNDPDKKGRLQVSFDNQKFTDCRSEESRLCVKDSCRKDDRVWIDRMDAYAHKGLGPAYIPQIDDIVRVHLYRGDVRIVGCVRTEAYGSPYENCNAKYLLLDDDVYVQFDEGVISVHHKNNQVRVSGEEILIKSGEKAEISASKDKVLIRKDKTALEITADINMTGKNFTVKAKGDVSISGTKVNVKGKSGVSLN